ncbi:unnamed protein product [Penicillium bialowiezense]
MSLCLLSKEQCGVNKSMPEWIYKIVVFQGFGDSERLLYNTDQKNLGNRLHYPVDSPNKKPNLPPSVTMDSDHISLWPRYQASIFMSPCKHWIPDPHHCRRQHTWVTATLPISMSSNSHSDEELMCYVYQRIKLGKRMVFDAPWPCAVSADSLLEVPESWKKPSYAGWL